MGLPVELVPGEFGWENPPQRLQSLALFGFANLHGACREPRLPATGTGPGEPEHKVLVTVLVLRSPQDLEALSPLVKLL